MLQWRMRQQKERDNRDIRILRTMATFAPAFGMLGTLLGLVSLLGDLGQSGMEYIGVAMGFALMSTLYGLLAANLLFRPLALKMEDRSRRQLLHMNFLVDAIMMLYERQHPVLIGEFMNSVQPGPDAKLPGAKVHALPLQGMRA
jgi:chemotaxis protein MotA